MRKLFGAGLGVAALATTLVFAQSRATGQPAKSADPIFGRWMMDQARSVNNRNGDHATFPTQHVRILAPEGEGVRNTLANTPTAARNTRMPLRSTERITPIRASRAGIKRWPTGTSRRI